MRLYHATMPKAARSIMEAGFQYEKVHFLKSKLFAGVRLSDRAPYYQERAKGGVTIMVDIPEEVVAAHEWREAGKPYREFVVPAEIVNRYHPFEVITGDCPIGIVERALEFRDHHLKSKGRLPEHGYLRLGVSTGYYDVILAEIRHEYTNHEDLLNKLPQCPCRPRCDKAGTPDCPMREGECEHAGVAHELLKTAAKDLAERIYQEWLAAKRA